MLITKVVLLGCLIFVTFTDDAQGLKCFVCLDCAKDPGREVQCAELPDKLPVVGCSTEKSEKQTVKKCYYATPENKCHEGDKFPADDPGKERCVKKKSSMEVLTCLQDSLVGTGSTGGETTTEAETTTVGDVDYQAARGLPGDGKTEMCICKMDGCNTGAKVGTQLGILIAAVFVQLAVFYY